MTESPTILSDPAALREAIGQMRGRGQKIGLVPTMGALHEGHLSLVDHLAPMVDAVVCSIFVNPKQFGANEDLDSYPRQMEDDVALLSDKKVQLVFAPRVEDMYPDDFQTTVSVGAVSTGLCGGSRPGHFDGVATVVAKLLLLVLPDVAVFGEKDYQQLLVIRQMVRDLAIPVQIEGAPIIRADDGLALSSRNAYLTSGERAAAPLLQQTLVNSAGRLKRGDDSAVVVRDAIAALSAGGFDVDYFEVRDAGTLAPLSGPVPPGTARLLAAARLGSTRLIDNVAV